MVLTAIKKFNASIGSLLSKEYKINLGHCLILLWIPFSAYSQKDNIYASTFILLVLLLGVNKEQRKEMFNWAQPWTILMPFFVTISYCLILTKILN